MIIQSVIYWFLMAFLICYIFNKYNKSKNENYLYIFLMQFVLAVINIACIIIKINIDWYIELFVLVINFIIPAAILFADYYRVDLDEFLSIRFGDYYAKKGIYSKAITNYKNALSKDPNSADLYAKLGRMYKLSGDRRTAFDRFAKAIELNRDDFMSYYEIGSIFNDMGKYQDAEVVLNNALRIRPDYTPASLVLAEVLLVQQKYDAAVTVYKDALKYDEENYELYYYLGNCKTELELLDEAKDYYKKAIEINPTMYEAYFSLGQIYLLNNNTSEAEKMYKKSLLGNNIMAPSYYQLAKIAILRDDSDSAIYYLNNAIEVDSSYKDKALNEPMFSKIKEYVLGVGIASKAFNGAVDIELPNEKSKKVSKKAFNIEEDDDTDKADAESYKDEITEVIDNNVEETKDVEQEEKHDDFEQRFKAYVDEAEKNEDDLKDESFSKNDDLDDVEENEFIEDDNKPNKKEHKVFNFIKNVFGFYDEDDDDEDEEEQDEQSFDDDSKSKVRLARSEEETNYDNTDDYTRYEREEPSISSQNDNSYEIRKANYMNNDLDIYEQFKKLKEEEDEKAKRLSRVRFANEDSILDKDEDSVSTVRKVGKTKEDYRKEFEEINRKKSFDFDEESNEYTRVETNDEVNKSFEEPKLDDNEEQNHSNFNSKLYEKKHTIKSDDDDYSAGFDYLRRYKR